MPPGRSRLRAKLIVLAAGAGIAVMAGSLIRVALTAPHTAAQRGTNTAAARPAESTLGAGSPAGSAGAGTPAGTAPSTSPYPWLKGLGGLYQQMNQALGAGQITRSSLRVSARMLRRCTPGLAALGPPPSGLRHTYRMARRACADFERGAGFAAAAARAYTTAGPGSRQARTLEALLNRSDAAVNRGIGLMARAYYGAPVVQPGRSPGQARR